MGHLANGLDNLRRNLFYAGRTLRRTPGFTLVAVLTLALGIGTATAMFSVVYGILLRPLPYAHAERLMLIQRERDLNGAHRPASVFFNSQADINAWQQALAAFESSALYSPEVAALSTDQGNEVVQTAVVSGGFFSTLAAPIAAGRPLGPADDGAPAVVISTRLAERLFATTPAALGQHLSFSSSAYMVAGVADPRVQFPSEKTDVWMPSGFMKTVSPRCCNFRLFGRLRPGGTQAEVAAQADTFAKVPGPLVSGPHDSLRATATSVRDQIVGSVRPALLLLFAAVTLVLLVACANVVSLLLTRHVARGREVAIRRALGASRGQLVMQFLVEATVLALGGLSVGIVLAVGSIRLLRHWPPPGLPEVDAIQVDWPVLLFSLGLACIAVISAGLLPTWRVANAPGDSTGVGEGVTAATSNRRIGRMLCMAELAVSLVLLVGATLLGRSLARLMQTDLGVETDHVVTASLNMAFGGRPTDAQVVQRVDRVLQRVADTPGVRTVGVGTALPPNTSRLTLTLRGTDVSAPYTAAAVAVTPDYFHALGMRLLRGRLFTANDDLDHPPVMIMNADTAKRFFGETEPIGRTLGLPVLRNGRTTNEQMALVGIVSNVKYSGLDALADDAVYRPFSQQTLPAPFLVVRTTGDPEEFAPTLRRAIAAADRAMVVAEVRALESIVLEAAAQPRFRSELLIAIAALALAISAVGLYGVVAYSVAQRSQEIGVRMALGAQRFDVQLMVLREGVLIATGGIIAGVAISLAASRGLAGLLYGVAPTDAVSYGLASGSLFAIAMVACYVPARRAALVDPLVALRHD
jgi:putative ABC transport system permease protein